MNFIALQTALDCLLTKDVSLALRLSLRRHTRAEIQGCCVLCSDLNENGRLCSALTLDAAPQFTERNG